VYRTLKVCSNSGAYEALPESHRTLDLGAARRKLEQEGIAVVDARVLLVAALEVEVTIARSGRLLFKTRDEEAARRCFERLHRLLDLDALPDRPESRGPGSRASTP
jgi:hypothetical protein